MRPATPIPPLPNELFYTKWGWNKYDKCYQRRAWVPFTMCPYKRDFDIMQAKFPCGDIN